NLDELFYLRSRGLSQDAARDHLVRGFCRELLQEVNLPDLYDKFSGEIHAYLSR
ncbi:MAG: SufD family Fe-S cluster assembly protein, partial [Simkania sp.]|nr:SufD family Fe-S cluster assembly protein [Simkania sp.]